VNVRVPGDKSLTQRALILAALADGESRLSGLLYGGDAASTAGALRALGATIPPLPPDGSEVRVRGVGLRGLRSPASPLDLGNSGTGARLLLGVLAGSNLVATLTGDASLRGRPMGRVTEPLNVMGATFSHVGDRGRLPIRVEGRSPLSAVDWSSPVASAQIKSSILLAGLTGQAFTLITEPRQSRDHTERLLRLLGVSIVEHAVAGGWRVEMRDPPGHLQPLDFEVPGDPSSAAFLFAAAALGVAGERGVTVENVGLNPTRTAFLDVLERMGADVRCESPGLADDRVGEPRGSVRVAPAELRATRVSGGEVPRLIDELPLIAVLGSRAAGVTEITGAGELRAKESDRIDATVRNLRAIGAKVEERPDGLAVTGSEAPYAGSIRSYHDHRITMAFGILGFSNSCDIEIDDANVARVSYPTFWRTMERIASIGRER